MGRAYRVVVWGPGEVGGAVARAAHRRPDIELAGAKVFSERKHGADLGDLLGLGPIGVAATTSAREILALDADCVIVTPRPDALGAKLDADVIALLESGKNVISTAAYHNAAMPNWLTASRPPPSRLVEACRTGRATLHGTGVHPTFMIERVAMTMARGVSAVSHVRCVEAVDFAAAAGAMWGGLGRIGFGSDPAELGAGKPLALFGDLYYGDLTGNVAHHLFGASMDEVRVVHDLRGIPAAERFQTRSGFTVEPGRTAALHLTHKGYLGDRCFFTNEECWYLGAPNAFRGDDLPYPDREGHSPVDYTIEITGDPSTLRTRLTFDPSPGASGTDRTNPVTAASVRAILDALPAVCAAEPGILIDDPTPHYVLDDRVRP
ncbi:hypothetical protein [Actinomadura sp. WMMA1423]|uniref:hypothetical protein n=1 Tax=Actinomadura sp. WMMA1423 TaxID=2591108 RepID=UPI001147065C|nr:hypothetical protein [Actinomadura sp. WMMA1423]